MFSGGKERVHWEGIDLRFSDVFREKRKVALGRNRLKIEKHKF